MTQEDASKRVGIGGIREAMALLVELRQILGMRASGKTILWVDDHPENNQIPYAVLDGAGAFVCLAHSTQEAAAYMSATRSCDLLITDMGRAESPLAGLDLVQQLRRSAVSTPVIVYSDNPEAESRRDELAGIGAIGPVLGPRNLISEIARTLQRPTVTESQGPTSRGS